MGAPHFHEFFWELLLGPPNKCWRKVYTCGIKGKETLKYVKLFCLSYLFSGRTVLPEPHLFGAIMTWKTVERSVPNPAFCSHPVSPDMLGSGRNIKSTGKSHTLGHRAHHRLRPHRPPERSPSRYLTAAVLNSCVLRFLLYLSTCLWKFTRHIKWPKNAWKDRTNMKSTVRLGSNARIILTFFLKW